MTTYVRVMYVFDKHVHALNLFVISIFTVDFSYHVRVWHLILKKNYYCPLNNYILHNIKRFMQDKPCFYQEFENERRLAQY